MTEKAETTVAAVAVLWLRERGWDVHQEVETHDGRADIVAVNAQNHLWIIEVKTRLTLDLVGQAIAQKGCAHYVSVCVPTARGRGQDVVEDVLRREGIGLLMSLGDDIREDIAPRVTLGHMALERMNWRRRWNQREWSFLEVHAERITQLRRRLCEETRTFAEAGNASSRYWSSWKETEKTVRDALRQIGRPATTKEIAAHVAEHHRYLKLSARNMYGWFYRGLIPGVQRVEGRPLRWELAA